MSDPTRCDTAADFRAALSRLPADRAVGLAVALDAYGSPRCWVLANAEGSRLEVSVDAWRDAAADLEQWLRPTYPIAVRAQDVLRAWPGPLATAPKVACATTAATLIAEGADKRRSHRRLDHLRQTWLQHPPDDRLRAQDPIRDAHEAASSAVPLLKAMTPALREQGLTAVFELECDLLPHVVAMERAGIGFDAAAFERMAEGWRTARSSAEPGPIADRLDKLLSTYAHWGRDFATGARMHTHLDPIAAPTGRFACTEPNLQQVPNAATAPGFRECFVARPGHVLVIADYAQIELRVAASIAGCAALRQVFVDGGDPHRATAAALARKAPETITDEERKLAKAVNFGFLFGMGAKRFRGYAESSYGLELSDAQATRARASYLAAYPGIAAWHRRVANLQRQGHEAIRVRTVLGRTRRFDPGTFSFATALNVPVQGTAAEGFKRAMILLGQRLPRLGAQGVLCVHDEYLTEAPAESAAEARACVEACMVEGMAEVVRDVPIAVESHVAQHWG